MIKYIGISGRIASGKSTLSGKMDRVFNAFDLFTVRSSFATGVKYLASLEHNSARWIHAERYFTRLSNSDVSRNIALLFDGFARYPSTEGVKNRKLLQFIGTELGRDSIHPDVWVNDVIYRAEHITPKPQYVIIDDLRHWNESHFVNHHITIDSTSTDTLREIYKDRISAFPADYLFSDHSSEKDFLRNPDWIVPVGFQNYHIANVIASIILKDYDEKL